MNYGSELAGGCRVPRGAQDFYQQKQRAAEFYRANGVPQRLEEALNTLYYQRPADVYASLANFFSQFVKAPVICRMAARKLLDARAWPALEVDLFCTVKNNEKFICSSMISSHSELAETAPPTVVEVQEKELNASVDIALQWIKESLNPLISGVLPSEQLKIDLLLSDFFAKALYEEQEKVRIEKEEREASEGPPEPEPVPIPASAPANGKKKGSAKGKKNAPVEKPIPPAEPVEPVLAGSPAIGGVSLTVAKAGAIINRMPLYMHIASLKHEKMLPMKLTMPLPLVSLLSCGRSSPGKLNLMKEVLVLPQNDLSIQKSLDMCLALHKEISNLIDSASKTGPVVRRVSPLGCAIIPCDRLEQPLDLIQEACNTLELELGQHLRLAINCAAHELMDYSKGKYEVLSGVSKNPDEMVDLYADLINKHPSIVALIDPLRKEDTQEWSNLFDVLGSRCHLIAEAASPGVSKLLENHAINTPRFSGLVIRHINQNTVSDLLETFQLLSDRKDIAILGSTDGESSDDSLADLAVGLGAGFVKLGGLFRGELVNKYNRLMKIEEELSQSGTLGQRLELEFNRQPEKTLTQESILPNTEDEKE